MDYIVEKLDEVKHQIDPLTKTPYDETMNKLDRNEAAKLNVSIAYTLASLYYISIKTSGDMEDKSGNISEELSRIKSYVAKVNSQADNSAKKSRLDSGAAKRMINHQLS
mmetsp:Transcript_69351/g.136094  ORF Transcript_69351/g.136094 Transcript_69351/m.136094 type:complete len:109 (+) Transcript_69351:52-378(+)